MKRLISLSIILLSIAASAQSTAVIRQRFAPMSEAISSYLGKRIYTSDSLSVEKARVKSGHILEIQFSRYLNDTPLNFNDVDTIRRIAKAMIPQAYKGTCDSIEIISERAPIEKLATRLHHGMPRGKAAESNAFEAPAYPQVKNLSRPQYPTKGLQNRHLAIWQSHGLYFNQTEGRWGYQRAPLFGTVEDLYTQSYVLPFLVPMLENAGANVYLPRERDVQTAEYLVDNDTAASGYAESGSQWKTAEKKGFAIPVKPLLYKDNPFEKGTVRTVQCAAGGQASATWSPRVKRDGEYAVYVSYSTFSNSSPRARYTVTHNGGITEFEVNQKQGGSTWIYLGTFGFRAGAADQGVKLTNEGLPEHVVCADAVKFGGGYGTTARTQSVTDTNGKPVKRSFTMDPEVSGHPRFTEGSRYFLQYAGFCDTIYSPNNDANDYKDDFMSRAKWVNALAGGSSRLPGKPGYNVPLDLAFAFHSDAGKSLTDSIVGTLTIYTRLSEGKDKYAQGGSRDIARELADAIQTQVAEDLRTSFEPEWPRRGLWNRSYFESRYPEIPSVLLELLSHQNFADMRYGLDPAFRFTVSRSVYKAILKYVAHVNNEPYTVQPLPVQGFAGRLSGTEVELQWQPTDDPMEPTAKPDGYIVYTRKTSPADVFKADREPGAGIDGFDNGTFTREPHLKLKVAPGVIYSYKVTAVNAGGESFPSEILSVGKASNSKGTALIINNFTRVAAPASFATPDSTRAGFLHRIDGGVPYLRDISFIGEMYDFDRGSEWISDDNPGHGASYRNYQDSVIAGNTFDYPLIHGAALMAAGYSFDSASAASVKRGATKMGGYRLVDIICGKQMRTVTGIPHPYDSAAPIPSVRHRVFDEKLMDAISTCKTSGGNLIISGANIASDANTTIYNIAQDTLCSEDVLKAERSFEKRVLKIGWLVNGASATGQVKGVQNPLGIKMGRYSFNTMPNSRVYCVESPDGISAADKGACTIMRYADSEISAAVAYSAGGFKCVSLGFPIEALESREQVKLLMNDILRFFEN